MSEFISPFEAFYAAGGDSDAVSDEDVSTAVNNCRLDHRGSISNSIINVVSSQDIWESAVTTDEKLEPLKGPCVLEDSPVGGVLEPCHSLEQFDLGPRDYIRSSPSSPFETGASEDQRVHVLEDNDILTNLASSWGCFETSAKYVFDCVSGEVASIKDRDSDEGDTASRSGWKLQRKSHHGNEKRASFDSGCEGPKGVVRGAFLGEGSFGRVYEATVRGNRRAMKTMSVDFRTLQRAIEEAEVGCKMYHPNIARTFSYTVSEDCVDLGGLLGGAAKRTGNIPELRAQELSDMHFKVELEQELCDLGPLHRFITTDGFFERHNMPKEDCIALLSIDVARALMHLEERGVTHNDLSSKNVLLSSDSSSPLGIRAKVIDFGMSSSSSKQGSFGTLSHMPPEFMLGKRLVSRSKTDVYSLGVLMLEMWEGQHAWGRKRAVQIMYAVCNGHRLSIPVDMPDGLSDLVRSCLSEDPDDRPSARDLCASLMLLVDPHVLCVLSNGCRSET
jgi:hypothetical protein